jgi:hypothetical protein
LKDQARQRSQEAETERAAGVEVNGLVQLNLALLVLDGLLAKVLPLLKRTPSVSDPK